MSGLGVPVVDAARIVEGQAWASKRNDGRHYHKIVPMEVSVVCACVSIPRVTIVESCLSTMPTGINYMFFFPG